MCTMLVKKAVDYYTTNDTLVYFVMLDATKAFDRVNYVKLSVIMLKEKFQPRSLDCYLTCI